MARLQRMMADYSMPERTAGDHTGGVRAGQIPCGQGNFFRMMVSNWIHTIYVAEERIFFRTMQGISAHNTGNFFVSGDIYENSSAVLL